LGRFISADTIAPGLGNPQNRNRYSYALNNPLKYTDPTGHCNVDGSDGENTTSCESRLRDLGQLGISISDYRGGLWSLSELTVFLQGANALLTAMNWNIGEFNKYVGPVHAAQSADWGGTAWVGSGASALTSPSQGYANMTFFQGAINGVRDGKNIFLETVVHELAHAWDFNGGGHSLGMMATTGSYYRDPTPGEIIDDLSHGRATGAKYVTTGTTSYGGNNSGEDWAESVTAYVFDPSRVNSTRINYIANLYGSTGRYGGGGGSGGAR
jgi:hypothetical protein